MFTHFQIINFFQDNLNCDQGTQFPPPAPGLFGYGENHVKPGTYVESNSAYVESKVEIENVHISP